MDVAASVDGAASVVVAGVPKGPADGLLLVAAAVHLLLPFHHRDRNDVGDDSLHGDNSLHDDNNVRDDGRDLHDIVHK